MNIGDNVVDMSKYADMPITQQLAQAIRGLIQDNTYLPKDLLPSNHRLSKDNGFAALTARNAYMILEKEGLVRTKQGVGTFVAEANYVKEELEFEIEKELNTLAKHYDSLYVSKRELRKKIETKIREKMENELDATITKALENGLLANEVLELFDEMN